jgi:membrane-anchored protein YejM (alkaline phosphatase superfamily)
MLAHAVYVLALSNGREVIGAGGTAFTLVVALIFAVQIAYSHWARRRGLIR